MRTWKTKE